jgi:hypothetical protein
MSYTSKRLGFMMVMSLGASKSLRRVWLWCCWILLLVSILAMYAALPHEAAVNVAERNTYQLILYVGFGGVCLSLTGFGYWVVAHVIRFFGKNVKDDYRKDKLFKR